MIKDSLMEMPQNKINNTTDVHYLTALPPNEKKRLPTRPYKVCSKVKQKESRDECTVCREKPSLCDSKCFKIYHSKE